MNGSHVRKKEDTIKLLEKMIREHGDDLQLVAMKVDQGPDSKLYTTSTSVAFLNTCVERLPREYEKDNAINQVLWAESVNEIKEAHLVSERCDMPNSITLMFKPCDYYDLEPVSDIGGFAAPKNMFFIKVHLDRILACLKSDAAEVDEDGALLDPEKATLGYLVDGHHRNEGLYLASLENPEKLSYEFSANIYIGRSVKDMPKVFTAINSKQSKPLASHVTAMLDMSGELSRMEQRVNRLVHSLNSNDDSVFKDRIRICEGATPKGSPRSFVSAKKLAALIERWLDDAAKCRVACVTSLSEMEQYKFLNGYLAAYKGLFPEAWDNNKCVLTKSMGVDIMFSQLNGLTVHILWSGVTGGKAPGKEDFMRMLKEMLFVTGPDGNSIPITVCLDGEHAVPFDWASETFGPFSTGKGIGKVKDFLNRKALEG